MTGVDLSDFDYDLPGELIAQEPPERRGDSRLMVLDGDRVMHRRFHDLPELLREGDVLVLNDSRVIPARIRGKRETGGKVELLVLGTDGQKAEALVRSKPLRPGEAIRLADGTCTVLERVAGSRYRFEFCTDGGVSRYLETHGEMPTPLYIKKRLQRQERYQTVFAREPGSVAAPTAGLHFTPEMLDTLGEKGVQMAFVTLHIGPATFQPVRAGSVGEHRMEPEYFQIPAGTALAINGRSGRLIAVGTTTVKALESAMLTGERGAGNREQGGSGQQGAGSGEAAGNGNQATGDCSLLPAARPLPAPRSRLPAPPGKLAPTEGWSGLFIYPGHKFKLKPDGMLTNFHLPRSSLLMLVSALVGRERLLEAYAEAVKQKYRFYSFGDAMLCLI